MQKIFAVSLAAVALSFAFVGCGPGEPTIATTNPTGKLGGAAWSLKKATIKRDGSSIDVKLFGDDVADCASTSDKGYIMFSMPATVGKRALKFSLNFSDPANQTVTFFTPPSNNNIATEGLLNLTELTDTSATLGLSVKSGADNEVNGTLTATLCK
ncbi:MAG: hypothetical protein K1X64_05740 [Myxococcaceae bacterium]|nr:hypothetical protein [Myxococcaceae bacterium]